jgi:hypothetical protein
MRVLLWSNGRIALALFSPPSALSIVLELDRDSETSRTFRFRGSGAWAERLAGVTP